ncbi:MAG: hypothetical protein M3680_30685 [Myxococcota bacterium]|nr:hypothetical protein [Myxococcota bacterium]
MIDHDHRTVLAAHPTALVERCGCGAIHVTIGAITLRLQPDAFLAIAAALEGAARSMVLAPLGGGHPRTLLA